MIKWGISAYNHNAAISVVKDDQILFASESERYSGIKNDSNIPENMIKEVLEYGEPDQIHWYENQLLKNIRRLYAGQKWKKLDIHPWIKRKRIRYHGHHETHARAGFYTSPFDSATVLVVDAIGEFNTTSIWHATNKHLTKFWTENYPNSLGLFYSAITHRVGLKPNEEEYILMGMAAYGDPYKYYSHMKPLLKQNLHRGCRNWLPGVQGQQDSFDIAASAQLIYTEEFEKLVSLASATSPNKNLVLMGGCALNCVANYIALKYFDNVWIMPAPGDAGSSLGAALDKKVEWKGPYLGHNIEGDYPVTDIIKELKKDRLIGVANGRAEFGPRAFGNRSLLADPRGLQVKDKVNEIKRRQKFRPFAPVVMEEHAHELFDMLVSSSPYMQYVIRCKEPTKYPAIVHKDGTSRVQTVNKKQHLGLYTLLSEWYKETGCPMLLNTSLNIKGKPMVNTMADAKEFERTYNVRVA
jgi:carbamoyltransferase|tara:strand:- start:24646 stop:26049 length:1404 start_codon:yes stop_codon:yes gene_type:complete